MDAVTSNRSADPTSRRVGGLSAVALGVGYIAITGLYVAGGALPAGAAKRLTHLAHHTEIWWAILTLSVATDVLFMPTMWSLYQELKGTASTAMLAGTGLVGLFVVLDLAVTWPNYSTLITLSGTYVGATNDTQRTVALGAASYANAVLSSGLFGVYAILAPAAGIFIIGLVMFKGGFGKVAAYLGISTGVLGFISVVGSLIVRAAGTVAIAASIATTLWVLLVGYKLLTMGPATRLAATTAPPAT